MEKINEEQQPGQTENVLSIRIIKTEADRLAAYRFRYSVYVEEMRRPQLWADRELKTVIDPLDQTGQLLGAFKGNQMVGTGRVNFSKDSQFEYPELYDFELFETYNPGRVSFVSKLMVSPEYRRGPLFIKLVKALYRSTLDGGAEVIIIDCNDHLVPVFERLGLHSYRGKVLHPEYGWVTPMAIYNRDEANLRLNKSPFLQVNIQYKLDNMIDIAVREPAQEQI